jgi:hypothetical protein
MVSHDIANSQPPPRANPLTAARTCARERHAAAVKVHGEVQRGTGNRQGLTHRHREQLNFLKCGVRCSCIARCVRDGHAHHTGNVRASHERLFAGPCNDQAPEGTVGNQRSQLVQSGVQLGDDSRAERVECLRATDRQHAHVVTHIYLDGFQRGSALPAVETRPKHTRSA